MVVSGDTACLCNWVSICAKAWAPLQPFWPPHPPSNAAWPGVRDLGIIFGAQLRVGGAGAGHVAFIYIFTFL